MPRIVEVLRVVREAGYLAVLVTSQRCVGKGLISPEGLEEIHSRMQSSLAKEGAELDAIYAFTGEPGTEDWEKPKPGMIEAAVTEHGIDADRSLLVGDADRDIEMARAAGIRTAIRVVGDKPVGVEADHTVGDLTELEALLLELC